MHKIRIPVLISTLLLGVAALILAIAFLTTTSTALAHDSLMLGPEMPAPVLQAPPEPKISMFVVFTDPAVSVAVLDLSGVSIAQGLHVGGLKCNGDNCSQKTALDLPPLAEVGTADIVYRFTELLALDLQNSTAVVRGIGTIASNGTKERFSFSAIFEDNGDGTLWTRYEASRPEASFIIPSTPGIFEAFSKR